MNKEQLGVELFPQKYTCVNKSTPEIPPDDLMLLRTRLIIEEVGEFAKAASCSDMEGMVDALCDLLYVTYGTAVVMGVDLEPLFAEVQRSNMTKDGGGHDSGGKVVKGPDFEEPDLLTILHQQGWKQHGTSVVG